MSSGAGVLVVGGGLAAQRCVETLRKRGYEQPIRIVCAEDELPYDRPPLSKGVLAGQIEPGTVRFREPSWYADNAIDLILGQRATALNVTERTVELEDGSRLDFDDLVIATGAAPRSLRQLERFENAISLRGLDDTRRLREELVPGSRLVIVGAGFIGQEVAATALGLGVDVTVVEALELPLGGLLGEEVGRWLVAMHRDEGARMLLSARLAGASGNGRVETLELESGEQLRCDAVVVGVGVAPATEWLRGSGLDLDGVRTDAEGRTALPHIYAAGDAVRPFDPRLADHVRTEHWDAASRQGAAVAKAILGESPVIAPPPSFWSDQYGTRIQYAGHAAGADEIVVSGSPADRDFHVLYRRAGRPVAGLAVNRPRDLAAMRRLIDDNTGDAK